MQGAPFVHMQQQTRFGPTDGMGDEPTGRGLVALLALVGAKSAGLEELRRRTKLAPPAFTTLVNWLQQEYLVDVVTSLDGARIDERVELTERGEAVLISLLERTCELPELR